LSLGVKFSVPEIGLDLPFSAIGSGYVDYIGP
jgi:hypothetical protein